MGRLGKTKRWRANSLVIVSPTNLDNHSLLDATTMSKVYPSNKVQTCVDPDILVCFPLHLLSSYIISLASSIAPLQSHQEVGKPGTLLLRFQFPGVAPLLYGMRMSTTNGPISFTCGDGSTDAFWEPQAGFTPMAPLSERQCKLPPPSGPPSLTAENLQALASGNQPGKVMQGSTEGSPM